MRDALLAGAALGLFALSLTVAERCRPKWAAVAVVVGTAAASYGTLMACRVIERWVLLRAGGVV